MANLGFKTAACALFNRGTTLYVYYASYQQFCRHIVSALRATSGKEKNSTTELNNLLWKICFQQKNNDDILEMFFGKDFAG